MQTSTSARRHARAEAEEATKQAALEIKRKEARHKRKAERASQPSEGDFSPNSACDDVVDEILAYLAPIDLRELGMCNDEWREFLIDDNVNGRLARRCHQVCPRDEENVTHAIFGVPWEPIAGTCFVVGWECSARTGEIRLTTTIGHDEMHRRLFHWSHPLPCTAVAEVRNELASIGFEYEPYVDFQTKEQAQHAIRTLSVAFRDATSCAWMPRNGPDAIANLVYMQHVALQMKLSADWRKRCRRMACTLFERLSADMSGLWPPVLHLLQDVRKLDALLAGA